jgi:hypothetical protein
MHFFGALWIEITADLAGAACLACGGLAAIEFVAVIYDAKPSCATMGGFSVGAVSGFQVGCSQQSHE